MVVAAAAATAMSAAALGVARFLAARRREGGKLLGDFRGTAMRAFRPLPVGGADEDFAVVFALGAMKFVNRHEGSIRSKVENFLEIFAEPQCGHFVPFQSAERTRISLSCSHWAQ